MQKNILISGFGGQGMMRLGKILAQSALAEGKFTSWFPSYGAEMRGGTAHCFVKISSFPVSSPFIEIPDIAVIFNQPSLDKFKNSFKKYTLAILNTDLIQNCRVKKGKIISCPLNKIALGCGSLKTANIAALGIILALENKLLKTETVISVLKENFFGKKELGKNLKVLREGEKYVKS